jgi:hypothetical protein
VVTPLTDPDNEYLAELSLDNGATYRQAELVDYQQGPIDDKNIGVRIALDWTCTEPIASKPALGSGAW